MRGAVALQRDAMNLIQLAEYALFALLFELNMPGTLYQSKVYLGVLGFWGFGVFTSVKV